MKLFIVGRGQAGKDYIADHLRLRTGWSFESSSSFVARRAVWSVMGADYADFVSFYRDRRNRRSEWQAAIKRYNQPLDRLTKEIFAVHDIYVGIRDREEFLASRHHADLSIWVDADLRSPSDDPMTIRREDCDISIDNNGTKEDLNRKLDRLCETWKVGHIEISQRALRSIEAANAERERKYRNVILAIRQLVNFRDQAIDMWTVQPKEKIDGVV